MPPQGSPAPIRGVPSCPGTHVRVDVVGQQTFSSGGKLLWQHALIGNEHDVVDRVEALEQLDDGR